MKSLVVFMLVALVLGIGYAAALAEFDYAYVPADARLANPERRLLERAPDNNAAWVSFQLTREPGSPPRLALLGHSACDTAGMCGAQSLPDGDGADGE